MAADGPGTDAFLKFYKHLMPLARPNLGLDHGRYWDGTKVLELPKTSEGRFFVDGRRWAFFEEHLRADPSSLSIDPAKIPGSRWVELVPKPEARLLWNEEEALFFDAEVDRQVITQDQLRAIITLRQASPDNSHACV